MTLRDVAELSGLCWDAVKEIAKRRLRRDYGHIELQGVRYLSVDEIYVGKRKKLLHAGVGPGKRTHRLGATGARQGRFAGASGDVCG